MSKNKFTPGPWVAVFEPDWNQWSVRSANAEDLAEAPVYYELASSIGGHVRGDNFDDYSEVSANAHLIAAAPELLQALENLIAAYSSPDDRICCNGTDCGCMGATEHQLAEHYARAAIAKARGE